MFPVVSGGTARELVLLNELLFLLVETEKSDYFITV